MTPSHVISDIKERCTLLITPDIEKFLKQFTFTQMPKGFLVAKGQKPFWQCTIHYPDHFQTGNYTSLFHWRHTNPWNNVEYRFSFSPVDPEKPETCTPEEFLHCFDFAAHCKKREEIEKCLTSEDYEI